MGPFFGDNKAVDEVEILATFDTEETAFLVAKALNRWFSWVVEGEGEDPGEPFEDFGVSLEDYALDQDNDIDWTDLPVAKANGNRVSIGLDSANTVNTLEELLESLGAYEVSVAEEEE